MTADHQEVMPSTQTTTFTSGRPEDRPDRGGDRATGTPGGGPDRGMDNPPVADKAHYRDDSVVAQHLHDLRVNKTRGKEVAKIPRTCIECGADATPRYLYCCDEHAEKNRRENSRRMWQP